MPDASLFRSKTIGVRVTEDDYARFAGPGRCAGVDEWCREVMLASVKPHATGSQQPGTAEMHAVMAELVALRPILHKR